MYGCVQDNPSRILRNDVTTVLAGNTPAVCAAHCAGLGYARASVENGAECHCGTGIVGTPFVLPSSQCSTLCPGDARFTCGGAWAMEVLGGPQPVDALPEGWSVAMACAVDTADRVLEGDVVQNLANNTPATCTEHCATSGYSFAGVEYGQECHCGTGYAGGVAPEEAPASECNIPCAGSPALTCGGSWRLQIYSA